MIKCPVSIGLFLLSFALHSFILHLSFYLWLATLANFKLTVTRLLIYPAFKRTVLWFFDSWEKFSLALETYIICGVLKTVHGKLSGSVVWPELAFACSTPHTSSLQRVVSWMNESRLLVGRSVGRSVDRSDYCCCCVCALFGVIYLFSLIVHHFRLLFQFTFFSSAFFFRLFHAAGLLACLLFVQVNSARRHAETYSPISGKVKKGRIIIDHRSVPVATGASFGWSPRLTEMSLAVWPPLLLLCSMALTTSPPAFEITAGHQIVADDLCPGVDRSATAVAVFSSSSSSSSSSIC
ncbi:hypothetical protein T4D_17150 [Trichinella pseudospiralis]|uniref:Uncharacterized protein n=1 Tax=Trichinella pseudospiralis TaxID=6337 RepID=A0A0V1FQM7_TRIPS|nr:hypothetical protein T4D_17150 [Trichinella pseudospiralis]